MDGTEYAQLVNSLGLVVDLAGVWIVGSAVIERRNTSRDLGVSRLSYSEQEDNYKLPAVQDRIRSSRHALAGGLVFSAGILLQLVATWMPR